MLCTLCEGKTKFINSRTVSNPGVGQGGLWMAISACNMENIVWRVRQCLSCQAKAETIELVSVALITLIKRDVTLRGRHEF